MKKYGMMNQVQCGAPLKKVSDMMRPLVGRRSGAARRLLVHAALPQAHEGQQAEYRGPRHRECAGLLQVARRQLRVARQAVLLSLLHPEIEGVAPAQRPPGVVAVPLAPSSAPGVQRS